MILLLLLFFCPCVSAKTVQTDYLEVKEVDNNYVLKEDEKIKVVPYYKQVKNNPSFKYMIKDLDGYNCDYNDMEYGKYSKFQKYKLDSSFLDEEEKVVYFYKDLKKIKMFSIKNINNLMITNITLKYKNKVIYSTDEIKNTYQIILDRTYSLLDLTLDITCFLNQENDEGSFLIYNDNYINSKYVVKNKGFNYLNIKLINSMERWKFDKSINKTTNIDDKFYIKLIKKEKYYRYRPIYYKCYKDEITVSNRVLEGYRVVDSYNKYYLYRKERIEFYDDIILKDYLDLDKVIISSTIPLSKLHFEYINNCSDTYLYVSYRDYEIKIKVKFECSNYNKKNDG